jgi:hypothetical protein
MEAGDHQANTRPRLLRTYPDARGHQDEQQSPHHQQGGAQSHQHLINVDQHDQGGPGGAGAVARGGVGRLNNDNDSPESGSLYNSDGYNSGEQYDTISTGYMSGEAYELPEARMDMREPALDVIDECLRPLGASFNSYEESIFMVPTVTVLGTPHQSGSEYIEQDEDDLTSTSSGAENAEDKDSILNSNSPMVTYNKKLRKKATTFAIPIESSPLSKAEEELYNEGYDESSDPGMGDAPTGGYRAVPSDTDTSAIDSDPNAVVIDGRHKKIGKKAKKNLKLHDEAWFAAHDSKTWSVVRVACFWGVIISMLGATVLAAILISVMPRNCDPHLKWYQGIVIMDVVPNRPGALDIGQLVSKLPEYKEIGVSTLHLKKLQQLDNLNNDSSATPDLVNIAKTVLGNETEITKLVDQIHDSNMTIIVQIPVADKDAKDKFSLALQHDVDLAIQFWITCGVDGIFLDGLEDFEANIWLAQQISAWQSLLERYGPKTEKARILMTSYKFAHAISNNGLPQDVVNTAMNHINLLDAQVDLDLMTNMTQMTSDIQSITEWDTVQARPWINWNLKTSLPLSNAAIAFQMLLPGTINLNDNLEVYPSSSSSSNTGALKNMTSLRTLAVPIYMNGNYKRCDCEEGLTKEVNYIVHAPIAETIQLERYYSRRNRYVLVANFGDLEVNLEAVGKIYSGGVLVLDTSQSLPDVGLEDSSVKFSSISLHPGEAIVIKLPK